MTMGTIRVSDAAERYLYENSRMNDSFDTVLRRLLPKISEYDALITAEKGGGAAASAPPKKPRAKKGTVIPTGFFAPLIIKVLAAAPGHKLHAREVVKQLGALAQSH